MNRSRLFFISCLALTTTAVAFSMRGDALDGLRADFLLTNEQIGVALSPAFWGNTVAILIGGALADYFGMRRLLQLSSVGYIIAPLLVIFAPRPATAVTPYYTDPGFLCLYGGMLLLGLSQGLVEGAINPLVSTLYPREKTHRFSLLHAWWPGGLILGGLLAYGLTKLMGLDATGIARSTVTFGWRIKMAAILLPAIVYGLMVSREKLPPTERAAAGVSNGEMWREAMRPMFLLLFIVMCMTSSAELGPDQWVGPLIGNLTGMRGILILVYTAGIMFLLRFFVGGRLAKILSPIGLLTVCAVLTTAGLFALAGVTAPAQAFMAATLFGAGKTFFWPTMLGVTAERFPRGGALLLALMGGAGNLAVAFILPLMGSWYDQYGAATAFRYVSVIPMILIIIFAALGFYYRRRGGYRDVQLEVSSQTVY
jgi:MFS family permease